MKLKLVVVAYCLAVVVFLRWLYAPSSTRDAPAATSRQRSSWEALQEIQELERRGIPFAPSEKARRILGLTLAQWNALQTAILAAGTPSPVMDGGTTARLLGVMVIPCTTQTTPAFSLLDHGTTQGGRVVRDSESADPSDVLR
jgi:hypothetical protein